MKRAKVKGSRSISLRSTQPLEADSQRSYIPASSFQKLRRLSRRTFAPLPHPRGRALSHQLSYTIPRPSSCCLLIRNWSFGSSSSQTDRMSVDHNLTPVRMESINGAHLRVHSESFIPTIHGRSS